MKSIQKQRQNSSASGQVTEVFPAHLVESFNCSCSNQSIIQVQYWMPFLLHHVEALWKCNGLGVDAPQSTRLHVSAQAI